MRSSNGTGHQSARRAGHGEPLIPTEQERHPSGARVHSAAESDPDGEDDRGADRRAIIGRKDGSGGKETWRSSRDEKRALKVKEAAFRYGIGRTNLYRLIKSGALRSVKLGRARLILVDALEALLNGE